MERQGALPTGTGVVGTSPAGLPYVLLAYCDIPIESMATIENWLGEVRFVPLQDGTFLSYVSQPRRD